MSFILDNSEKPKAPKAPKKPLVSRDKKDGILSALQSIGLFAPALPVAADILAQGSASAMRDSMGGAAVFGMVS